VGRGLHRRAIGLFRVVPVALAAAGLTAEERDQNMSQQLTVVVTGSTGKRGGAVARGQPERGHKVRAVTRDPTQARRSCSRKPGATLVQASLEDTAAIRKGGSDTSSADFGLPPLAFTQRHLNSDRPAFSKHQAAIQERRLDSGFVRTNALAQLKRNTATW
jgi:NAD(P)-dependent dehydrogenase (short-subunit alcohol dehydrogenase family)